MADQNPKTAITAQCHQIAGLLLLEMARQGVDFYELDTRLEVTSGTVRQYFDHLFNGEGDQVYVGTITLIAHALGMQFVSHLGHKDVKHDF